MSEQPPTPDEQPAQTETETEAETEVEAEDTVENEAETEAETEPEWRRRRRLAAVFGDVLPEQTSDDRDAAGSKQGVGDSWYRDQVPPHHG